MGTARRVDDEPRVCPACHSPFWNQPDKRPRMTYDDFNDEDRLAIGGARQGRSLGLRFGLRREFTASVPE